MADTPFPPAFTQTVTIRAEATVGGERLMVQMNVVEMAYADSGVRAMVHHDLRQRLMDEILKRWSPVIQVIRA